MWCAGVTISKRKVKRLQQLPSKLADYSETQNITLESQM